MAEVDVDVVGAPFPVLYGGGPPLVVGVELLLEELVGWLVPEAVLDVVGAELPEVVVVDPSLVVDEELVMRLVEVVELLQGGMLVKAAIPLLMAARIGADSSGATGARSGGVIAVRPLAREVAVDSCWLRSSKVWPAAQAATSRSFLEIKSLIAWLMLVLRFKIAGRISPTSVSLSTGEALTATMAAFVSVTIASESL